MNGLYMSNTHTGSTLPRKVTPSSMLFGGGDREEEEKEEEGEGFFSKPRPAPKKKKVTNVYIVHESEISSRIQIHTP